MRIISGRFKGKQIQFLKSLTTRPLKDSVKENIFNILAHSNKIKTKVENANILDLYSGVGSFGIECLSRGAKRVTFIEENIDIVKILKKNLSSLFDNDKVRIINDKIEKNLSYQREKFNIIFLDPPFADNKFIKNLQNIKKYKIFKDKHIVIIHREKKSDDKLADTIDQVLVKYYGRSKIIFGRII